IMGEPNGDAHHPKYGMVMDFGELKKIVNEQIVSKLDHAFVMRRSPQSQKVKENMTGVFSNIILVDYQPTCENMLCDFAQLIMSQLPSGVELFSLKLHETATSFAEWYAADNL
ncbi:MAG: 6-carboxytetrahydropterin synthase, partial [Rikenellaceae bacterium]